MAMNRLLRPLIAVGAIALAYPVSSVDHEKLSETLAETRNLFLRASALLQKKEEGAAVSTGIVDDADRAMDVSRKLYETGYISFPECIGRLFNDCLNIVNSDLAELGISSAEIVVHEKRNVDQVGELVKCDH